MNDPINTQTSTQADTQTSTLAALPGRSASTPVRDQALPALPRTRPARTRTGLPTALPPLRAADRIEVGDAQTRVAWEDGQFATRSTDPGVAALALVWMAARSVHSGKGKRLTRWISRAVCGGGVLLVAEAVRWLAG